jgi:hypothetical protein
MIMSHCDPNFLTHACTMPSMHDLNTVMNLVASYLSTTTDAAVAKIGKASAKLCWAQGWQRAQAHSMRKETCCVLLQSERLQCLRGLCMSGKCLQSCSAVLRSLPDFEWPQLRDVMSCSGWGQHTLNLPGVLYLPGVLSLNHTEA